jgi:hypothetical protein
MRLDKKNEHELNISCYIYYKLELKNKELERIIQRKREILFYKDQNGDLKD